MLPVGLIVLLGWLHGASLSLLVTCTQSREELTPLLTLSTLGNWYSDPCVSNDSSLYFGDNMTHKNGDDYMKMTHSPADSCFHGLWAKKDEDTCMSFISVGKLHIYMYAIGHVLNTQHFLVSMPTRHLKERRWP